MSCTKKTKYSSENAALKDIIRILLKNKERPKVPINAYLCKYCSSWHLTSQSEIKVFKETELKSKIIELELKILKLQHKLAPKELTNEENDRNKVLEQKLSKQGIKIARLNNEIYKLSSENIKLKKSLFEI